MLSRVLCTIVWLACVVSALDVCVLGARGGCAATLLARLVHRGHRVATWDEHDEDANRLLMRQGAVASFSGDACVAFGAVINVCDKVNTGVDLGDKPRIYWGDTVSRADADTHHRGTLETGLVTGPHGAVLSGDLATLAIALLPESATADVDDDGRVAPPADACPPQAAGGPQLWTRTFEPSELGCAAALQKTHEVCRVYAKLPNPTDRLYVIALYGTEEPVKTSDPEGFFHAFQSVTPSSKADVAAHESGACDSFITLGAAGDSSCATADPSFSREAFLRRGRIDVGGGWFCINPASKDTGALFASAGAANAHAGAPVPASASKPPNTDDSILVAQFTVRKGFTTTGKFTILGADAARKQFSQVQPFRCGCNSGQSQ